MALSIVHFADAALVDPKPCSNVMLSHAVR